MNRWYTVKYLDDMTGESVRTWEGYAEDSSDAIDRASYDDYYCGKIISIDYYEEMKGP